MFQWIEDGRFEPYTSYTVINELERAEDEQFKKMNALLEQYNIKVLEDSEDARNLADIYVSKGIIPLKYRTDARHIAIATVNGLHFVASYNFGHIVKLKTLNMTGLVNIRRGYYQVGLFSPTEVKEDDGR
jgi:hypothetical protein